jgi:hypothetical protein
LSIVHLPILLFEDLGQIIDASGHFLLIENLWERKKQQTAAEWIEAKSAPTPNPQFARRLGKVIKSI